MSQKIIADFHVHSTFSDGKMSIPELVDLYGSRGFGAIAITDHISEESCLIGRIAGCLGKVVTRATFPLYMEILRTECERAWKQYNMVLIAGFELSKNSILNHRSAHILGIGISQYLSADGDAATLARAIRGQGAVAIAAHPVYTRKLEKQTYYLWDNRRELEAEFDAWEVASGPFIFDEIRHSKLPKIASGDLHTLDQLFSWKTILNCERTQESILDEIRKQRINFEFYRRQMHSFAA